MTPERWAEIKGSVHEKFTVEASGREDFSDEPGWFEYLEFDVPQFGLLRLEWQQLPRVLKRIGHAAKRGGAAVSEEKVYSKSEFQYKLQIFRLEGDEWREIDADLLNKLA